MSGISECSEFRLGDLLLERVTKDGGVLSARADIAGTPHHVTLVQVREIDDDGGSRQVAVADPDDQFGNFHGADPGADGPFCTVKVPGHSGDWVLLVSPIVSRPGVCDACCR